MTRTVVKFDQIATPAEGYIDDVPDGYAGLHWSNFAAYNAKDPAVGPSSGYRNVVQSGTSCGFNGGAADASFTSDGTFSLKSGWFCAAFAPEEVTLVASLDGTEVGHKTFDVDNITPTFIKFGKKFAHIDSVTVQTGGEELSQLAMDNLVIKTDDAAAPEAMPEFQWAAQAPAYRPQFIDAGLLGIGAQHDWDMWLLA